MWYCSSPSALDSLQTWSIIGTQVLILGSINITLGSIVEFQILSRNSAGSLENAGKHGKFSSELVPDSTGKEVLVLISGSLAFFFRRTKFLEKQKPNIPKCRTSIKVELKIDVREKSVASC